MHFSQRSLTENINVHYQNKVISRVNRAKFLRVINNNNNYIILIDSKLEWKDIQKTFKKNCIEFCCAVISVSWCRQT